MQQIILEKVNHASSEALDAINKAKSVKELIDVKNTYLSKKSELNSLMIYMKDLNNDEKKEIGRASCRERV